MSERENQKYCCVAEQFVSRGRCCRGFEGSGWMVLPIIVCHPLAIHPSMIICSNFPLLSFIRFHCPFMCFLGFRVSGFFHLRPLTLVCLSHFFFCSNFCLLLSAFFVWAAFHWMKTYTHTVCKLNGICIESSTNMVKKKEYRELRGKPHPMTKCKHICTNIQSKSDH